MVIRVQTSRLSIVLTAVGAILLLTLLLTFAIGIKSSTLKGPAATRRVEIKPVARRGAVPEVEPVKLAAIAATDAKALNSAMPFSKAPNPPARPFRFSGSDQDRARALACLAAAVLYEAGDDDVGQQAVAQVVLNRVRHPAFPKTVCGVVFQGSERATGCQFTFTCDGALHRRYPDQVWGRAQAVAEAALSGAVYKPVGHATHYHTDWVVPYWSSSLDKIVGVGTHLFFRWTGWWGTPPAFRFESTGVEPRFSQLAARFPEHSSLSGDELSDEGTVSDSSSGGQGRAGQAIKSERIFFVHLTSKNAEQFPALAARTCANQDYCWFVGWTDAAKIPRNKVDNFSESQREAMSFSYLVDRRNNFKTIQWNCGQFKRSAEQCLRGETS